MEIEVGELVHERYRVQEVVSSGPVSTVYRVRDETSELGTYRGATFAAGVSGMLARPARRTDLTLKVVPSSRVDREWLVANLKHPHIVPVVDLFTEDDTTGIVMESAASSLRRRLETSGALPVGEVVVLGVQLGDALAYAHSRGVLHRDLKPSNVLVMPDGRYVLSDFGVLGELAARPGEAGLTTAAGEIAGTPLYMSPEQLVGQPQSVRSDLYGLGLLLYECLHGALPGGDAGSFAELARIRLAESIVVPASPLHDVLSRCLAREPADRFGAATDFVAALGFALAQAARAEPGGGLSELDWLGDEGREAPGRFDPDPPVLVVVPPPPGGGGPHGTPIPPVGTGHPGPGGTLPHTTPRPPARSGLRARLAVAGGGAVAIVAAAVVVTVATGRVDAGLAVAVGMLLAGAGLAAGWAIRHRASSRDPAIERRAADVLFGIEQRVDLTATLRVEVADLLASLRALDQRVLGVTLVAMVDEFGQASASQDRQAALLNIVTIMEKLQLRLSPWHVRHRDSIATAVAVTGCATGLVSAIAGLTG